MHISISACLICHYKLFLEQSFQPTKGNLPGQKIIPILDMTSPGSLYYQIGTVSKQSLLNIKHNLKTLIKYMMI